MKVFSSFYKFFFSPAYYLIHNNVFFGLFHKLFIGIFYYKNLKFTLDSKRIPLSVYSSFLFKTYEYNDRKLIEKYISSKSKCIIIGGGLGFIPALCYKKSNNKIIVFEIDHSICDNLKYNLSNNSCVFELFNKNLVFNDLSINKRSKFSHYYFHQNFLNNSMYRKANKVIKVENISFTKIKNFKKYNTLIIDAEGIEKYFIRNIKKLTNINYLFFELHNDIINSADYSNILNTLKKNNFFLFDKCFNSFFYKRVLI